jgi:hypothetical protein
MEFPAGAGQILTGAESPHKKYGITTGGANSLRDSRLHDQFRPEILVVELNPVTAYLLQQIFKKVLTNQMEVSYSRLSIY